MSNHTTIYVYESLILFNVFHYVIVDQPFICLFVPIGVIQTSRTGMWHTFVNNSLVKQTSFVKSFDALFSVVSHGYYHCG